MSVEKRSKINNLLATQPNGVVFLSSWLVQNGYSFGLQERYRASRWLESIGAGAMVRTGDKVGYDGAIYALQKHANSTIHPAARSALSLQGKTHYLELSANKIVIFGGTKERLPAWFQKHDWGKKIEYHPTSFLPPDLGLIDVELKNFSIKVSSPPRAIMECLYLAPQKQELMECFELMEGLNNMRPQSIQVLLEQCQSLKVKRLFMYMAEKVGHEWAKHLDLAKIDFGTGNRSLVKNGVYVGKYKITVPKELEEHGKSL